MEGFPIEEDILEMSRLEVLRRLIEFGRSRGYILHPEDFQEFSLERLQAELSDLRRHGTNSWVTGIGERVGTSHITRSTRR